MSVCADIAKDGMLYGTKRGEKPERGPVGPGRVVWLVARSLRFYFGNRCVGIRSRESSVWEVSLQVLLLFLHAWGGVDGGVGGGGGGLEAAADSPTRWG